MPKFFGGQLRVDPPAEVQSQWVGGYQKSLVDSVGQVHHPHAVEISQFHLKDDMPQS